MTNKVYDDKFVGKNIDSDASRKKKVGKTVVKEQKAIYRGVATTSIVVGDDMIERLEQVDIFEDKGDEWLTSKGLVSKMFLLLRKI